MTPPCFLPYRKIVSKKHRVYHRPSKVPPFLLFMVFFFTTSFAQLLPQEEGKVKKMDEHAINHQSSTKLPNSQAHSRTLEQNWLPDFQAFSNRLPMMSTIPHSAEMSMAFPPNWQAGSFQFLHPSGVLPYNLNMPTTDRTENVMPTLNHNISFSQSPPQSQNVDQNVNNQPSQQSNKRNVTGVAKVKEHWTVDEDVELCVAWLKISEDAITGTGQKQGAFWNRVADELNQVMKEKMQKDSTRTKDAANSRWQTIHPAVTKWSALHAMLTRTSNLQSGCNMEQVESRVRAAYRSKNKEAFKFEECWKILRDNYKWQTWNEGRSKRPEKGAHSVSESMRQQDTIYIVEENESPLTPGTETNNEANPLTPDTETTETDKDPNPHLTGPASRDKPRPPGNKKAINQRQRIKKRASEQQTLLRESISAALDGVDTRAEERFKRQEESKRHRDEVLDQRYHEQKRKAEMEHELTMEYKRKQKQLIEMEYEFTMESKKTEILKDLQYVNDQLALACKELEAIDQSSLRTPHERFEYEMKRDWVEQLEVQRAAKRKKLLLATSPVESPEGWTMPLGN